MSKLGGLIVPSVLAAAALMPVTPHSAFADEKRVGERPVVSEARAAVERQTRWRAAKAGRLAIPLPDTPDTERPLSRLWSAGLRLGEPMLIRIFKAESELEVWIRKRNTFSLFATYPICYWSGSLGPKLREGDRQAPEGFYVLTENELHHGGRWRRSLNIGYPNIFDRVNGRSGSNILVHGGCDSSGCFAMTDAVNAELFDLVSASLRTAAGIQLHVFPFRMTEANLAANPPGKWAEFWSDLKQGYDAFERTRLPPHVSVCGKRYRVRVSSPFERGIERIELCEQDRNLVPDHLQQQDNDEQAAIQPKLPAPKCSTQRASCRKWVTLRDRRIANHTVATRNESARPAVR